MNEEKKAWIMDSLKIAHESLNTIQKYLDNIRKRLEIIEKMVLGEE